MGDRVAVRHALRAGLIALATGIAACGGDQEAPAGLPASVPADIAAAPRDPGGSSNARSVRVPPRDRVFGMHGYLFAVSGNHPGAPMRVTVDEQLRSQRALGAMSTRIQIIWGELEPQPGNIDRGYVARIREYVDAARRAGGSVLLVLGVPPAWASQAPGDANAGVRDDEATVEAFARYAATVARLFPEALAIETWNEPNAAFFWRPGAPDPELFARLHRAAARAVRQAVPGMRVLVAGLLASHRDRPDVLRPQLFLKRMYAAGLEPRDYDGLAIHPYPTQSGGRMGPLDRGVFAAQWQDFRLGHVWKDPDARLWVTETGVTTSGPAAVAEDEQGRSLVSLTRKLLTAPRVEAVYLHTQYELGWLPRSDRERGFGVLLADPQGPDRAKPAACALRRLARDPGPVLGCD